MDERTGIDMGASVAVLGPQIAGLPEVVDVTRLLAAEKAGKNRKRVLTCLEKRGRALWQLLASPKGAVDQHGQMVAALAWCQETGRSARKAANLGVEGGLVTKGEKALWPDIKPGTLQGWLKNPALAEGGGHERQKILLLSELTDIYEALVEGADRHKFKDRSQIRTMIKQALRLRQLQTKQKVRGRKNHHFRKNAVPLSPAAMTVLASNGELPSNKWFSEKFYTVEARKKYNIVEFGETMDDSKRINALTVSKARHHVEEMALEAMTLPEPTVFEVPRDELSAFLAAARYVLQLSPY